MAEKAKKYSHRCYVEMGGNDPFPIEQLTSEQIQGLLIKMQDAYMDANGYVRCTDKQDVKAQ